MAKITNEQLSQLLARGIDNRLEPTAISGLKVGQTIEIAPEEWGLVVLDAPELRGTCVITSVNAKEGVIEVDSVPHGTKRGDFIVTRHS